MAQQSLVSISDQLADLSNWEFINQSDIEFQSDGDDSIYEVQSIDLAEELSPVEVDLDDSSADDDDVVGSHPVHTSGDLNCATVLVLGHDFHQDDDEGDEVGDYGVDDELVPWGVKDKFERQRIRKQGKVTFAKMMKSKRSAHIFTQRGCVRGKHALGFKGF